MRWDIRNSWLVAISSILSAAITVGEVAKGVWGTTGVIDPLRTPIPLWVLIVTVLLLAPLTLFAAKLTTRPREASNKGSAELVRAELEGQIRGCIGRLGVTVERLNEYESLENEILGYLADGKDISTIDLLSNLSISRKAEGRRILHLAVASLEQKGKIVGTGSFQPKLKLAPKAPIKDAEN